MRLLQKIIFVSGLIIASVYFIYTLSFSSGWALGQPLGAFYTNAQIVNKLIYKWALWTLVFSGLALILHSHTNRNFYISNYIIALLFVISLVGSGIVNIIQIPPLKASYLKLDPIFLTLITKINYSHVSTKIFDYGIYLSILMFVQAGFIIFITTYKTISQIKRAKVKKLRRLENAHENN